MKKRGIKMKTKKDKQLKRVTLEMSLKPFYSMEQSAIEEVCREAFRQWLPLIGISKSVSILLWVSDGSEILVWDGNLDSEIEWARYIGFANEWTFSHIQEDDPRTAILYTENPAIITYRDLRRIVQIFKEVGENFYKLDVKVGATFDAGPEFAYSDFKYKTHPEINHAELGGQFIGLKADYTVVCTWSRLKEDNFSYAAYPEGIPKRTPFGEFLGKQCSSFLPEIGFDYIWFSNGFALSYFPWTYLGANYDGKNMPLANYKELSEKVMSFWEHFKRECPDYPTELRGTNFGTGMDLAKDFISLKKLYEKKYVELPPPNSPWGALNYDFGLEMVGYMSRIAELPGETYPFRYYPNDPWFWQNPWKDLYDREPHDIYCPLSAARISKNGELEPPGIIELLTIDTEKGVLDEEVAEEVFPHLRRALQNFPNQPGLLTWIYPFDELHKIIEQDESNTSAVFFHDWFMRNAINEGLPMNTVISSGNWMESDFINWDNTILVASTFWLQAEKAKKLIQHVQQGGKVLLYGPVQNEELLRLLNLKHEVGLEGELALHIEDFETDKILTKDERYLKIIHYSKISDGPISEILQNEGDHHTTVHATVAQGEKNRVFALHRSNPEWNGGEVAWVRGSLPYQEANVTNLPIQQTKEFMDSTVLMRYLLQDFGYTLLQSKTEISDSSALLFLTRKDNGFRFVGSKKNTAVQFVFRFPEGIPLLIGETTSNRNSKGSYSLDRTFYNECRVFVDQENCNGVICREASPVPMKHMQTNRRLKVNNLKNAKLTIYPPVEAIKEQRVALQLNGQKADEWTKFLKDKVVMENVTGVVEITW